MTRLAQAGGTISSSKAAAAIPSSAPRTATEATSQTPATPSESRWGRAGFRRRHRRGGPGPRGGGGVGDVAAPGGARPWPCLRDQGHGSAGALAHARFKALAEEVGITLEKDPRIGLVPDRRPGRDPAAYVYVIAELERALRMHRAVEHRGDLAKGPCRRRACAAVAPHPGRRAWLAAGPIVCGGGHSVEARFVNRE